MAEAEKGRKRLVGKKMTAMSPWSVLLSVIG